MTSKNKYTGIVSNGEGTRPSTSSVSDRSKKRLGYSAGKKARFETASDKRKSPVSLKFRSAAQKIRNGIADRKKTTALIVGLSLIVVTGIVYWTGQRTDEEPLDIRPETVVEELPKEKPAFDLAYPVGRQEEAYDVVRISPEGAEPSYAYLDRFTDEGAIFRVTQQKIPANFSLAKTAEDFQATNVIQVDSTTVYHGYSEKGGVQSLLVEKNELLILIRSPERFTDDTWASYIAAMK